MIHKKVISSALWNGHSTSVTSSSTLAYFKRSLKTEMHNHAFDCNRFVTSYTYDSSLQ